MRHIWEPYLQTDVFSLAVIYARHALQVQKMTKSGIKEALTEASLGRKCMGVDNNEREFYTFKNEYVRYVIPKSIEGGKVCAFNSYFELKQFDKMILTIKKQLNIHDNEISNVLIKTSNI